LLETPLLSAGNVVSRRCGNARRAVVGAAVALAVGFVPAWMQRLPFSVTVVGYDRLPIQLPAPLVELDQATRELLLGTSMQQLADAHRQELIDAFGFRPDEVTPTTFQAEVTAFLRTLARHLGERHAGEPRIGQALREWIRRCDHYEAWDALLSGFQVEGRDVLLRRGRMLFPGPLTAHWDDR